MKGVLALACALLMAAFQPAEAQAQAVSQTSLTQNGARVRAGFVVRPDTVTVGDRFTMIVTVDVPSSARIEWAAIQDSTAVVAMGAPVKVTREQVRNGNEFRTERAEYTLTAWDVGMLPVGLPDATVRVGSVALKVPLGDARIFVKSVLPGDTTLHVPKPARDLFPRTVPWWQQWWLAMVIAALLGVLWWFWRRRAKPGAARERVVLDPYTRAMRDFERLDRLELADAGECGRYVALAVEVLRTYIVARIPAASLSLTSVELLVEIGDDKRVPHDRLLSLLADADTIKFAGRSVTAARSRELAVDARRIVDGIEAAEKARVAAEAAARAAAVEAERAASKRVEDAARKDSRRPKAGV